MSLGPGQVLSPREDAGSLLNRGLLLLLLLLAAFIAGLFILTGWNERHPERDRAYFFAHVDRLAGPGAVDCGRNRFQVHEPVPLPLDRNAQNPASESRDPLPCIREALDQGHSFQMIHQGFPWRDYEDIWHGFVRDEQGRLWQLHFDYSFPAKPAMYEWQCLEPPPVPLQSIMDLGSSCRHPADPR